jgi:hypothetical protein
MSALLSGQKVNERRALGRKTRDSLGVGAPFPQGQKRKTFAGIVRESGADWYSGEACSAPVILFFCFSLFAAC